MLSPGEEKALNFTVWFLITAIGTGATILMLVWINP